MDLFLETPKLIFTKSASVELDEDSRNWTQQILAEAFQACPSIGEFSATVTFRSKDDTQGYAFGAVVVEAATRSALAATRVGAARPGRVAIPVIVRSYQLMPLDIFISADGRALPLTDARLREALFTTEIGDSVTTDIGDTSIYNLLYPLGRAGNGGEFGMGMGGGMGSGVTTVFGPGMKFASAMDEGTYSLLDELAITLRAPDLETVKTALAEPAIKAAMASPGPFQDAVRLLASVEPSALTTADTLVKAAQAMARADVIQLGHDHEGYWMRTACSNAYSTPETYALDRGQFLKIAGPELTKKVDTEGTVTVGAQQAPADAPRTPAKPVTETGIYRVRIDGQGDGKELVGWVIPNLIGLDGLVLPQAVFTNGAVSMVQDQIAGVRAATGADLPNDEPKGIGVFYAGREGNVQATVPVVVKARQEIDGVPAWVVQTTEGEDTVLRYAPGLQGIEFVDGELFIPESAGFISLGEGAALSLEDGGADSLESVPGGIPAEKTASASTVTIKSSTGFDYRLSFANADKLAALVRSRGELDHDDAMFVLALGGVSPQTASTKLAAAERGAVTLPVRDVVLFAELQKQASDETASLASLIGALRVSLVKEAASMPSSTTVDAVLSLGFINPENVRLFLARLPYLEKSLSMVCEMVIASRLGLTSIPEGAASRAARALDAVITGLRGLALMEIDQAA